MAAHRRLLVSARRNADRRVLAVGRAARGTLAAGPGCVPPTGAGADKDCRPWRRIHRLLRRRLLASGGPRGPLRRSGKAREGHRPARLDAQRLQRLASHSSARRHRLFRCDPDALADADVIALCVKSGATEDAGKQIAEHGRDRRDGHQPAERHQQCRGAGARAGQPVPDRPWDGALQCRLPRRWPFSQRSGGRPVCRRPCRDASIVGRDRPVTRCPEAVGRHDRHRLGQAADQPQQCSQCLVGTDIARRTPRSRLPARVRRLDARGTAAARQGRDRAGQGRCRWAEAAAVGHPIARLAVPQPLHESLEDRRQGALVDG